MLKKLVKYGNSNALVIDKALLELLNIKEGSPVKISTDGKSLIISPHQKTEIDQISKTVDPEKKTFEASLQAISLPELKQAAWQLYEDFGKNHLDTKYLRQHGKLLSELSIKYLDKHKPNPNLMAAFNKVHAKYHHLRAQVSAIKKNPDYIHDSVLLAEKHPDTKSAEYIKESNILIAKYIPEYGLYQEEMKTICALYPSPKKEDLHD